MGSRGRKPKIEKPKRPKEGTKEDLIKFLTENKETELPFNPNVWDIAVEKTKDKERKYKESIVKDFDGKEAKKVIPNGTINPIGKYFQLMALPQYKNNPYIEESEFDEVYLEDDDSDDELEQSDDSDVDYGDKEEIITDWIKTFFGDYKPQEKKFLHERLADYYDNYELNDGADKMIAIMALTDEIEVMNLTKLRNKGKDVEARLEKVKKSYMNSLEGLKALKKQRGKMDEEANNRFTLWLDELSKEEDFKPKKIVYDKDEIDFMIDALTKSIMAVSRDG